MPQHSRIHTRHRNAGAAAQDSKRKLGASLFLESIRPQGTCEYGVYIRALALVGRMCEHTRLNAANLGNHSPLCLPSLCAAVGRAGRELLFPYR